MKKYKLLYEELKDKILSGTYHEKLPSEAELIAEYDVSRTTIRRAVDLLKDEGIVISKHGKGVLIMEQRPLDRVVTGMDNFVGVGKKSSEKYTTEIVEFDQQLVKKELSEISMFPVNTVVTEIKRVRTSQGGIKNLDLNYFSYALTEGLTEEDAVSSIYQYLGQTKQIEIEMVYRKITVEYPIAFDLEYLALDEHEMVAVVHNHVYTTDGDLLEYTQLRYRATEFTFNDIVRKKK